jgi:hypothetical protein
VIGARCARRIDALGNQRELAPLRDERADVAAAAIESKHSRRPASPRHVRGIDVHEPERRLVAPAGQRRLTGQRHHAVARDLREHVI